MSDKNTLCPCGRKHQMQVLRFERCCARYLNHYDEQPAPDAESLMRSRYSAFVLERADYLKATWYKENCPADIDFDEGVKWLGLDVKRQLQIDSDHAQVEFVARSRLNGHATRLHETSRFVRENGRWFYVDGVFEQPH